MSVVTNCNISLNPHFSPIPTESSRPPEIHVYNTYLKDQVGSAEAEECHSRPCPFIFNGEVPLGPTHLNELISNGYFPKHKGEINMCFQLNSSTKTGLSIAGKGAVFFPIKAVGLCQHDQYPKETQKANHTIGCPWK